MRIVTWNLNHRGKRRVIPPGVAMALRTMRPDIVVLTEYVQGPMHAAFVAALASAGLANVTWSSPVAGHNQILIASKHAQQIRLIVYPDIHSAVASNSWLVELA